MNLFCNKKNNGSFAKGIAMGMIAGGLVGLSAAVFTDDDRMRQMKRMTDKCLRKTKAAFEHMGR